MALIFGLSSISHPPELPELPGPGSDKYAHVLLYGGLSALFVRARAGGWRRPVAFGVVVSAVVFCTAYGVTDELHQFFVPPRQMDVFDVMSDAIGATLAAGLLYAGIIRERHGR
jgi:VanZ family protein